MVEKEKFIQLIPENTSIAAFKLGGDVIRKRVIAWVLKSNNEIRPLCWIEEGGLVEDPGAFLEFLGLEMDGKPQEWKREIWEYEKEERKQKRLDMVQQKKKQVEHKHLKRRTHGYKKSATS